MSGQAAPTDLFGETVADRRSMSSHQSRWSGSDEWLTPPDLIRALGSFDLDPCSPGSRRPWDTAARHLSLEDDGMRHPWEGRVWLNPPYADTGRWLARLAEHGHGTALIFARTETRVWFEQVWPKAAALLFIQGRLTFYTVAGQRARANSGAPSVLVAYGSGDADALAGALIGGQYVDLRSPDGEVHPMSPDDPRHGSRAGYRAHQSARSKPCDACRSAAARYEQERQISGPRMVDATGTVRRVQALSAMGYSFSAIGRRLGTTDDTPQHLATQPQTQVRRTTAVRVARVYAAMCMTPPPADTPARRGIATQLRNHARQKGWAPPLAWDDIDDPAERPQGMRTAITDAVAARVEVLEHAIEHGHTIERVAADLGIARDSVHMWCSRWGYLDLYAVLADRAFGRAGRGREVAA